MSKVFGNNLRAYRTMAHMTQLDLAKAAGITRSAVNNYESGASEPSFETLCRFSSALGVTFDDLINEKTEYQNFIHRVQVTDDEWALINAYRRVDEEYQRVVLDMLRLRARATTTQVRTVDGSTHTMQYMPGDD